MRTARSPADPTSEAARRRVVRARVVRRRRLTAAAIVVLVLAAATALLRSGGTSPRTPAAAVTETVRAVPPAAVSPVPTTRSSSTPAPAPAATPIPSAGSLPQTHALPAASGRLFDGMMSALWAAIVHASVSTALPAFFPRGAYEQLKAIGAPGFDWTSRLVRDFGRDIGAANRLLGAGAPNAQLLAVKVPSGYSHWVSPGACYNAVGYYEVPNARVVYREGGEVRSFGIASMISWRGVWYVVHLGAVLPEGESGTVDEPSAGPGTSQYSGTC